MSIETLTSRFAVTAAPGEIAAYLTDPAHYVDLNPFVIGVTDVHEHDGSVEFAAIERIRLLGHFHQNNPLRVVVRTEVPDNRIAYEITTRGGISVHIVTTLTHIDGGTGVQDTITLTVPRLVRRFALKQARVAQQHRAKVLCRLDSERA